MAGWMVFWAKELVLWVARLAALYYIATQAFEIRLAAVNKYGRVIHEFDPWFNFRVTDYINRHGYSKFVDWFDYESWYPIGRPVGTTTFPGLMVTSSVLHDVLNMAGYPISLNDMCVFIPAVFSVVTCFFVFLFAWEVSGSANAAVVAAGVMGILPAHLMRSVAGGYDNESVAMCAIIATFYFWVRSLRTEGSWKWGFVTGFAYVYMVSTWGAYPFVLNTIGLHCALLAAYAFLTGSFDRNLYLAYTIFFAIGTAGALQFPVVGTLPLKSLEQICPLILFFGMQFVAFLHYTRQRYAMNTSQYALFVVKATAVGVLVAAVVLALLPEGYFGPLGARTRGLFVPHTKTGNPLVDSVAEHQETNPDSYWTFFHVVRDIAPWGLALALLKPSRASLFFVVYSLAAGYFSRKMVRLVLLLAPAASTGAGMVIGMVVEWSLSAFVAPLISFFTSSSSKTKDTTTTTTKPTASPSPSTPTTPTPAEASSTPVDSPKKSESAASIASPTKKSAGKKGSNRNQKSSTTTKSHDDGSKSKQDSLHVRFYLFVQTVLSNKLLRFVLAIVLLTLLARTLHQHQDFVKHCWQMGEQMSEPHIMVSTRRNDGSLRIVDDFRQAYWWLRDHTPEDSRVMAWWDYGYQINGIGNRTTIADGNTWNHEHIALLGKCLVSDVKTAHSLIKHLADYVLVWTTRWGGMPGDDLAKMPHMARIASSVYFDVPKDGYWVDQQNNPSPLMSKSLLWHLHSYLLDPSVSEPAGFRHVYTSAHRLVRIFAVKNVAMVSKRFVATNHTYPPALEGILAKANPFARERENIYLDHFAKQN